MVLITSSCKSNFNDVTLEFFDIYKLQRRNLVDKGPMFPLGLAP